ncbi:hypothetical protein Dimus_034183 [Dionaea muscipula]
MGNIGRPRKVFGSGRGQGTKQISLVVTQKWGDEDARDIESRRGGQSDAGHSFLEAARAGMVRLFNNQGQWKPKGKDGGGDFVVEKGVVPPKGSGAGEEDIQGRRGASDGGRGRLGGPAEWTLVAGKGGGGVGERSVDDKSNFVVSSRFRVLELPG